MRLTVDEITVQQLFDPKVRSHDVEEARKQTLRRAKELRQRARESREQLPAQACD